MVEEQEFDPKRSRWGFITFRAHVSEPQLFEDFLNIFLPILNTFDYFAYSIEKDDTPDRHIHCIFNLTPAMKDRSKIDQKFSNKFMKDFIKSLKMKQTQWVHAYKSKMVENSLEDFLKILGYCIKDDDCRRRQIKNIPTNFLTQGIKFHVSTARIEQSCSKNDWKPITPKNVHALIEHFSEQQNIDVTETELIPAMVASKHTFVQITSPQLKLALSELKYSKYQNEEEKMEILAHAQDFRQEQNRDDEYAKMKYVAEQLIKQLNFDQIEKLPKVVQELIDSPLFY